MEVVVTTGALQSSSATGWMPVAEPISSENWREKNQVWLFYWNHPMTAWLSGVVVGCRTCDQQVTGSNHSRPTVEFNPRQVVNTQASITKQYNLVAAHGWWCLAAGKVTVGLESHWPHVTDISGSRAQGLEEEDEHPLCSLVEHGWLYLYLTQWLITTIIIIIITIIIIIINNIISSNSSCSQ